MPTPRNSTAGGWAEWPQYARVGVVAGLAVQYGSLVVHPLASFWPVPYAAVSAGLLLHVWRGKPTMGFVQTVSIKRWVFIGAAVANLVLQAMARESATGGLTTGIRDGDHVLLNHGKVSRRLSPVEYRRISQTERAFNAAVGVLMCVFLAVAISRVGPNEADPDP